MRKAAALFLLAGLMAGMLAACGGQESGKNAQTEAVSAVSEQTASDSAESEAVTSEESQLTAAASEASLEAKLDLPEVDMLDSKTVMLKVEGDDYPLTVTDALGNVTVLEKKPERVAVVSGTLLNIWYQLGGDSVCSSDISSNLILFRERSEEMLAIPRAGAVYQLNLEAVMAQKPDLIITQTGVQTTAAAKLKEMGFTVIETNAKTVEHLCQVYEGFGKILGNTEEAESYIKGLYGSLADIQEKVPDTHPTCVILYVTNSSVSVKLDSSIAGDIAYMLGLSNIASGLPADTLGSENTPLDIEYIVQKNPDLLMVTSMVSDNEKARDMVNTMFSENPAWSTVRAVKEGHVIYLPQQYYLYNAGPYYKDAVMYMAQSVYPEVFGEPADVIE